MRISGVEAESEGRSWIDRAVKIFYLNIVEAKTFAAYSQIRLQIDGICQKKS